MTMIIPDVQSAFHRLQGHVHRTPILTSEKMNALFSGVQVYFKAEMFQKVGAFKARGAMNTLLALKEKNALPDRIVSVSSGNHAAAVAWASSQFNIPATIYMGAESSPLKRTATASYGATVVVTKDRFEAEALVAQEKANGAFFLPPFDHDDVIAGQGTSCYEALQDLKHVDAVFVACGGGGWFSGTYLATQLLCPTAKVYAVEPELADDAYRSYKTGQIQRLTSIPMTVADGVRTPSICDRTFQFIQKCHDFITVDENAILSWAKKMNQYLKVIAEPTSALGLAGLEKAIAKGDFKAGDRVLIMLSGGNLDPETQKKICDAD